jgi:DNA-directed RNA polymerase specialized sigma24 family protein
MTNNEIIQYYDYLIRLATSKCNSQNDAEDLVGDTMLAAFAYMYRGEIIEHPKTWLTNTLYHKHNDNLRKKYRAPVTVYLDESLKKFVTVFPACGSSNSAIELTMEELEKYSLFKEWVDVCKLKE